MNARFALIVLFAAVPLIAQAPPRGLRDARVEALEVRVRQMGEEFATVRKGYERDVRVLRHLRAADAALVDSMQPASAIQKAFEEVSAAESVAPPPEFFLQQGLMRARQQIEAARRSPGSADFGRLRAVLREEALGPASRVTVRNAMRMQEEMEAWLRLQRVIGDHLAALSDLAGESLRESQK